MVSQSKIQNLKSKWVQAQIASCFEPNIYLYDKYPGGVGLSEPLFRMSQSLLEKTQKLIADCPCASGCPSCVGPIGEVGEKGKEVALEILRRLSRFVVSSPSGRAKDGSDPSSGDWGRWRCESNDKGTSQPVALPMGSAFPFGRSRIYRLHANSRNQAPHQFPGAGSGSRRGGTEPEARANLHRFEEQSVVNGKVDPTTESIRGLACRVSSIPRGNAVRLKRPGANTTYTVGARSGHSVLEFSIREDGNYKFACDYGENSHGPEAVVAVGSGIGEGIPPRRRMPWSDVRGVRRILIVGQIKHDQERKRIRQLGQVPI